MLAFAQTNLGPVAAAVTNALRDPKPPIAIASRWELLWWIGGILFVFALLLGLLIFLILRSQRKPAPPLIPAHLRARQQLDAALALLSQPKPFVIAISDTLRGYLEERFNFRAPERTTEEFLLDLQRTPLLAHDQKASLGDFLQRCDLVKFARYEPTERELHDLHGAAVRLVNETEPQPEPVGGPALPPIVNPKS